MGCPKDEACDFYTQESDSCNCNENKPCEKEKVLKVEEKKEK